MDKADRVTQRFSAHIIKQRAIALERFAHWQAHAPNRCDPATVLSGLGTLYELFPSESRLRPVDVLFGQTLCGTIQSEML